MSTADLAAPGDVVKEHTQPQAIGIDLLSNPAFDFTNVKRSATGGTESSTPHKT